MNYNKNLKFAIDQWSERLYNSTVEQFPLQLKFFLNNIETNNVLSGIIKESCNKYFMDTHDLKKFSDNLHLEFYNKSFNNHEHQAAFCYQLTNYLVKNYGYNLNQFDEFVIGTYQETQNKVFKEVIQPIIYYLKDIIEETNSTIYLLEKYKRRTEWFTKEKLFEIYNLSKNKYEDLFEDDLRLFLFDQGIDYPFSTPKSNSGRTDIVGSINTSNPIIIEIKIFDRKKGYCKNRIKDGFSQIIRYTEDYNKNQGFLVIYNADKAEINFEFEQDNKFFPPMLVLNNKTYFFIVVNIFQNVSASKIGKTEVINITKDELTKQETIHP
jgi:hypothetical protein